MASLWKPPVCLTSYYSLWSSFHNKMYIDFNAGKSSVTLYLGKHSLSLALKCIVNKITVSRLHCMSFSDSIIRRSDVCPVSYQKQMRFQPQLCPLLPEL